MGCKQKKILSSQFVSRKLFVNILVFVLCAFPTLASTNCPAPFISSTSNTFGLVVCGSSSILSRYHAHAEKVLRNLIDYDHNLVPDNKKVLKEMLSNNAVFLVLSREEELELYERISDDHLRFTVVYEEEMVLSDAKEFDATVEEALHLVTAEGYSKVYPTHFGEFKGSEISTFLDKARGGFFEDVPMEYPSDAFFTYYDKTCDYGCQITEFLYWSITTLRGQQRFNWRDFEIEHEWRPESKEKLKAIAPDLVRFLLRSEFEILY